MFKTALLLVKFIGYALLIEGVTDYWIIRLKFSGKSPAHLAKMIDERAKMRRRMERYIHV